VRRLFTVAEARANGIGSNALRWGVHTGRWSRVEAGVYIVGGDDPTPVERAVAAVLRTGGVASGALAGILLELDSVVFRPPFVTVAPTGNGRRAGVRRRALPEDRITIVNGVRCTDGLQTLIDLAAVVDDRTFEQMLESALRKKLTTIASLDAASGAPRIRRVLALRPPNAPPTESLLETLMVQLAREVPGLRAPDRQAVITDVHGGFVARVDLAWPEPGLFVELDGEHHKGQPVYDASRETAIVAATGWLCGRFSWTEVVHHRQHTIRRLAQLVEQARRRPPRSRCE
jgi:very-short-patch-repair endonuclease